MRYTNRRILFFTYTSARTHRVRCDEDSDQQSSWTPPWQSSGVQRRCRPAPFVTWRLRLVSMSSDCRPPSTPALPLPRHTSSPSLRPSSPTAVLSTHADMQGVDISVTVSLCISTVTDFSAEDKASGVKFCTAVHRRPRQGISRTCELSSPRSPKSDGSTGARATPTRM